MDKKRFYVSVQSQTIMENQGDAAYELEIEATEDERGQLEEIFKEMADFDQGSAVRMPLATEESNGGYDYFLKEAYALMEKLGTDETKRHIAQMHILS